MAVVPERFSFFVLESMIGNFLGLDGTPVLVGIFGPPGFGKTFQLRQICAREQVEVFSLNAADLESDRAGQPGKYVRTKYEEARQRVCGGRPACVVVDDFDTTGGEWDQHTGTINHLQVLAELMHLADDPHLVRGALRPCVFLTGNDLSRLYPPLRRPGRMRSMYWEPNRDERRAIVGDIFGASASEKAIAWLVRHYSSAPISFFSDVRARAVAIRCQRLVGSLSGRLDLVCSRPDQHRRYFELEVAEQPLDDEVRAAAVEIAESKALEAKSYVDIGES